MDRGARQTTVHGVVKSQTRLRDLACTPLRAHVEPPMFYVVIRDQRLYCYPGLGPNATFAASWLCDLG